MISTEKFLAFKRSHPLGAIEAERRRDEAYENLKTMGFPTKKDEAWKYTSLTYLNDTDWSMNAGDDPEHHLSHEDLKWLAGQLSSEYVNIVFVNGLLNRTLSDDVDDFVCQSELSAEDLAPGQIESEKKVQALAHAFAHGKNKITFNSAHDGKIFHVVFYQKNRLPCVTQPINEVLIGDNLTVKIIVSYLSRDQQVEQVFNGHTKVTLGKNAHLEFLQLQSESLRDTHLSRIIFDLHEGSRLHSLDLALGAKVSRHYLQVNFLSSYAYARIMGLTAISQAQHADHYTFINHVTGANESMQKYKSILSGRATSAFRGRVRIERHAQKAQSQQLHNNLLLTREAVVNSIPQLEIYADDVKASHGSTVGQLNKEEIFYFLSRGISPQTAVKMLASGFAMEMTTVLDDPQLQTHILRVLDERIGRMISDV